MECTFVTCECGKKMKRTEVSGKYISWREEGKRGGREEGRGGRRGRGECDGGGSGEMRYMYER